MKKVLGNSAISQFDVLIIGSGAGGSAAADVLCRNGLKVLILEAGQNYFDHLDDAALQPVPAFSNDELKFQFRDLIRPSPVLEPRTWRNDPSEGDHRFVGDVVSLPKTVGGAAVVADLKTPRFQPTDFQLGTLIGAKHPDASFADWPVDYAMLEPFYVYAERKMGVQGDDGADPFAGPRSAPYPMKTGVQMFGALKVAEGARKLGYTPFAFPGAVNSRPYDGRPACNDCGFCTSYGCPTNARGTPPVTALRRALLTGNCLLLSETRAVKLLTNANRTQVTGVEALDPEGGRRTFTADRYVLAATPIEDARLLYLSGDGTSPLGNSSGLVGRNVTFHIHTSAVGVFEERLHGHRGRTVTMAINDFRGVPNDPNRPLCGIMEVSGVSDPIGEAGYYRQLMSLFGGFHPLKLKRLMQQSPARDRLIALATVGEDAPQLSNRVDLDPKIKDVDGLPVARVTYRSHAFELSASEFYRPKMLDILMASGAKWAAIAPLDDIPKTAHQHGTLRFGTDPSKAVCDANGRFHDLGNLYAADGSLFPTSSGFNPTLTIVALACRVGAAMVNPASPESAIR